MERGGEGGREERGKGSEMEGEKERGRNRRVAEAFVLTGEGTYVN